MLIKSRYFEVPDDLAAQILELLHARKSMTALAKTLTAVAMLHDDDVVISVLEDAAAEINDATIVMNNTQTKIIDFISALETK